MKENKEIFTYTYSARQQEEVRRILQKYTPPQEDKMELLRRLDKSAQQPGTIAGIALGVCGTLMLGLGMCCTMVWTGVFALGVAVGCTGIAVLALAYPMFLHLTKRRRAQLAPQIEALSRELLGNRLHAGEKQNDNGSLCSSRRTNQFFRPENAQSCLQQFLKYFVDVCYNKGAI